jgi:oligoribonuclease
MPHKRKRAKLAATAAAAVADGSTSSEINSKSNNKEERKLPEYTYQVVPTNTSPLVWVDLEMTGLEVGKHKIVEMACVITDAQLNIIAQSENIVIHQDEATIAGMNEWCKIQFAKTGLTEEIRRSKITTKECEARMVAFIKKHIKPGQSPLCGNSVHMDRQFLCTEMNSFMSQLHYRIVDVSTIKELALRWFPMLLMAAPRKQGKHRALEDVLESIDELKFYRSALFKPSTLTSESIEAPARTATTVQSSGVQEKS